MRSVTLAEACTLVTDGTHYTPPSVSDGVPFLTVKDMRPGYLAFDSASRISVEDYARARAGKSAPMGGDVLFSKDGTVGKVHVVADEPDFAVLSSIAILRPNPAYLEPRYLGHALRTPTVLRRAARSQTGTAIRRIILSDLERVTIPLPSLAEQRRIASVLDSADALRGKRRSACQLLTTLTASVFISMFGDPVTNGRRWPLTTLGVLGKLDRGVSRHRPRNAPELLGGPYPLVQTGDVARSGGVITAASGSYSEEGLRQSRLWPAGTLCITIAANIAMTGILGLDACFPDSVVGFTADPATTAYVQTWLSFLQPTLERSAPEFAQKNINLAILRQLSVPTPPASDMAKFAKAVEAIRGAQRDQCMSLAELDALFASLQQSSFDGPP